MKNNWRKRIFLGALAMTMAASVSVPAFAGAAPDGKTNASDLADTMALTNEWNEWVAEWENVKTDWTQISLTPGNDASQVNFAWYSKSAEAAPKLKIGKGKEMRNAKIYIAQQTDVNDVNGTAVKDADGVSYKSNKVTATGLKENATYYYSYQKDGKWTEPVAYTTKDSSDFSFIFVGDPQIGSSNEEKAKKPEDIAKPSFKTAQSESVRSDSFNWETTLEEAMAQTDGKASFVLSAGDQIQTNAKKVQDYSISEVEYAGYLSPDILKSLPVATTVGNHDADNPNYTYHFNTPNNSDLGSNDIVGGDYYFTYGDALFMMLNTQDTNVAEHKQFIEEAVAANKDCKWRIVTLHQDIYGSAEHSNEPEIINLRYELVPYFEANDVDVVLTGHDHAYSRSKMLLGGQKANTYTDDEFDEQLDKDLDVGESTDQIFTAPGNIKDDTTDPAEKAYLTYLNSIMDASAVETVKTEGGAVINPDGILYMTANSSSGSKYYDLVPRMQTYIANRWQEDVPTYSVVEVDENSLTINTYRTDNNEKIDESFTIVKASVDKKQLQAMIEDAQKTEVAAKDSYTADSYSIFEKALEGAQAVLDDKKATQSEIETAMKALTEAKSVLVKKEVPAPVQKANISSAVVAPIKTQVYTDKNITPVVKVTLNGKTLTKGTDYDVAYTNNKYTGKATVTITGKGAYTGTKTASFNIAPQKASLKSVKSTSAKKAKVVVKKAPGKVTGYQIKYATNSKFKNAKTKYTKKTTYTLSSLKSKKTYYVKVRAYKTVSGKNIYGAYSKTIKVKVK